MTAMQKTNPSQPALTGLGHLSVFRKRLLASSALRAVGGGLFGVLILVRVAYALPQDGKVADGQATIVQESAKKLTVNQTSDRVIINWRSFNIAADEWTQFVQPSSGSFALNRITGGNPTSIMGRLSANGGIMIVNPNGVIFGAGSQIDVNKLIASTANIKNHDFMAGRFNFTEAGNPNAMIVNKGTISIAEKGLAAFVAPAVANNGVIIARLGKVHLAAGNTFILDMYGDRLVNVAVDSKVMNQVIGLDGKPVDSSVENTGKIIADGGLVALTADVAREAVNNVINTSGIIMARSVSEQGGEIVLDGGDQGVVKVTGTLDASGKNEGEKGGRVIVTGEKVGLFEQAKLDVSGDAGGGRALVGGDYMGGKGDPAKIAAYKIKMEDGPVRNAQFAYVAEGATINADALRNGDGGKAVVWADQATRMYGSILARGGSQSGNGGFIETSGKEFLDVGRFAPNASATFGKSGTWLLDPNNVTITSFTSNGSFNGGSPNIFTPSAHQSDVNVATIESSLNSGTSVQISTGTTGTQSGYLSIDSNITKSSGGDATLALYAAGDIYNGSNASRTIQSIVGGGKLNVVMSTSAALHLGDYGAAGVAFNINTSGGDVNLTSNGTSGVVLRGAINAGAGDVSIKANSVVAGNYGIKLDASSATSIYGRDITLEGTGIVAGTDDSRSIQATRDVTLKGSSIGTGMNHLLVDGGNGRTLTIVQTDPTSSASREWTYLYLDSTGRKFGTIDVTMNDKNVSSGLSLKFHGSTDRVYLKDDGTTLEKGVRYNDDGSVAETFTYAIDVGQYSRNLTLRTDGLKVNIPSSLVRTGTGIYTLASTNVPSTTTTSTSTTTAKNQYISQLSRKPGNLIDTSKKHSDEKPDSPLPYGPKLPDDSFYSKDSKQYQQVARSKENINFFDNHMNDLIPGDIATSIAVRAFVPLIESGQYAAAAKGIEMKYGKMASGFFEHFFNGGGQDMNVNLKGFVAENPGAVNKIISTINTSDNISGSVYLSQLEIESSDWRGALGSVQVSWNKAGGKVTLSINEPYSWNPKQSAVQNDSRIQKVGDGFAYKDGSGNLVDCAKIDGVWYDKRDTYPIYKVMNEKIKDGDAKEFKVRGEITL
ncbi:MAG: filamentous hemagglutinin N-terminal domain-containing protein [Rhodospirillales bacterium]|nr:filamentous hemagglutinin N-terminal domain-containing protein [Rhodospirillales bacterium]